MAILNQTFSLSRGDSVFGRIQLPIGVLVLGEMPTIKSR